MLRRSRYALGMAAVLLCGLLAPISVADAAPAEPEAYYPPNVVAQFNAITDRADAMGFWLGVAPFDPALCYHWQGIARSHGPGTPHLFVSQSGNQPPVPCVQWCSEIPFPCSEVGDAPGTLNVVRMRSRATDGERLRSNRLVRNTESEDSRPDARDEIVTTIVFDGTGVWPAYGHPGGLQLVGDVLAVPLEAPYSGDPNMNEVMFVDVSDPEHPTPISSLEVPISDKFTAGLVAITPQPDGKYLMLLAGLKNLEVRYYESDGRALDDPALTWTHLDTWFPEEEGPTGGGCVGPVGSLLAGWPSGGLTDAAHQSLNFVREGGPTGDLYLIGGRSTSQVPGIGQDFFDLFRVHRNGSQIRLECVSKRHVHSFPASDGATFFHNNLAHFSAASGAYVSPSGELILYATEHDNDGPGGSVKFGEWRHTDMVRPGSPTLDPTVEPGGPYTVPEGSAVPVTALALPPSTKAWVQLWTDPDFTDDRYLVIDYPDWSLDDFDNFERLDDARNNPLKDGFSDQATSARWFAPVGCTIVLRNNVLSDPSPGDDTLTVAGDGLVGSIRHLGDLDDDISAVDFLDDCDHYYDPATLVVAWDLDGQPGFETVGANATFSAAALDGPSIATPGVRVRHPVDNRTATAQATVTITNVAPVVSTPLITDPLGREIGAEVEAALLGLPVTASATFDDAGLPDTHVAAIDWGDGSTTTTADLDELIPATGAGVGSLRHAHVYSAPGTYEIAVTVVDDDGDGHTVARTIEVVDARAALESIVEDLDELLSDATGAARNAFMAIRDVIDGNNLGRASNGALDKLDPDLLAAMEHLKAAIQAADSAEAVTGLDLEEMKGTIALVAYAIAVDKQAGALPHKRPAVADAIATGVSHLANEAWIAAIDAFKTAVQRA